MRQVGSALLLCALLGALLGGCSGREEDAAPGADVVRAEEAEIRLSQFFGVDGEGHARDLFNSERGQASETAKAGGGVKLPLLAGIVLQGGVPAAYFVSGSAAETAREGDRVAGRYQVVRIETAFVVLKDLSTGKSYQLLLTGS